MVRPPAGTRLSIISTAAALALVGMSGSIAAAAPADRQERAQESQSKASAQVASPGQSAADLSGALTPEDLVESLVGDGVTFDNVTYTGDDLAAGTVAGVDDLELGSGVALSTGSVAADPSSILGPNDDGGTTTGFGNPGDPMLDEIVSPNTTEDAAVLEFDFVPETDQISFSYVFGSEEYNEYVGSDYNDVFAFFVNGTNCAVTESGDRVTVNSINNDSNSGLYNDNDVDDGDPAFDTELDGFTTPLVCSAEVTAGEKNHVELAIADTSDDILDSAVVIGEGTFTANSAPVAEDASFTTPVNTPIDTPLTATDADGDELEYTVVDEPANGTLSGTGADLTFTPEEGFTGETSFTFSADDGVETSNVATVSITVEEEPKEEPTEDPTDDPTDDPTEGPSDEPTDEPTDEPSDGPAETPADDPRAGGDLPRTGVDTAMNLAIGGLLLLVGGAAVVLARRRRRK